MTTPHENSLIVYQIPGMPEKNSDPFGETTIGRYYGPDFFIPANIHFLKKHMTLSKRFYGTSILNKRLNCTDLDNHSAIWVKRRSASTTSLRAKTELVFFFKPYTTGTPNYQEPPKSFNPGPRSSLIRPW